MGYVAEPAAGERLFSPAAPLGVDRRRRLGRSQVILLVGFVLAFVLFDVLVIKRRQAHYPIVVSGPASMAKVSGVQCLLQVRTPIDCVSGTVEATTKLPRGLIVAATALTTGGQQVDGGEAIFEHIQPGKPEPFQLTFLVTNPETYHGCFITWHAAVAS
jgi:hypothetical protein